MRSMMKMVLGAAGFAGAVVGVVVLGVATAAEEPAAKEAAPKAAAATSASPATGYSGTFSDTSGRKGPLECKITRGESEKWTLKFTGKNEGDGGPKRAHECTFALPGKKDGTTLNLSGTTDVVRVGQFEVAIAVTDNTLEGKFKKTDGKNSGSFSMTLAK